MQKILSGDGTPDDVRNLLLNLEVSDRLLQLPMKDIQRQFHYSNIFAIALIFKRIDHDMLFPQSKDRNMKIWEKSITSIIEKETLIPIVPDSDNSHIIGAFNTDQIKHINNWMKTYKTITDQVDSPFGFNALLLAAFQKNALLYGPEVLKEKLRSEDLPTEDYRFLLEANTTDLSNRYQLIEKYLATRLVEEKNPPSAFYIFGLMYEDMINASVKYQSGEDNIDPQDIASLENAIDQWRHSNVRLQALEYFYAKSFHHNQTKQQDLEKLYTFCCLYLTLEEPLFPEENYIELQYENMEPHLNKIAQRPDYLNSPYRLAGRVNANILESSIIVNSKIYNPPTQED